MAGVGLLVVLLSVAGVKCQMYDRLYHDLFESYQPDTLPMTSLDSPVETMLGLTIIQVNSVNAESGVAEVEGWLDVQWTDVRLMWSIPDYADIQRINIKSSKIWTPDIETFSGYMKRSKSLAMLSADGTVFHSTKTKFSVPCEMGDYASNKTITCLIKLGSWTHSGFNIALRKRNEEMDLTNFRPTRWDIVSSRLENNTVYYACCAEPYPDVTGYLVLRDVKDEGFSITNWAQNIF